MRSCFCGSENASVPHPCACLISLCVCVCFFFSCVLFYAFHRFDDHRYSQRQLPSLLASMETEFNVSPKDVIALEWRVYEALGFSLFLPRAETMPHLARLLQRRRDSEAEHHET